MIVAIAYYGFLVLLGLFLLALIFGIVDSAVTEFRREYVDVDPADVKADEDDEDA